MTPIKNITRSVSNLSTKKHALARLEDLATKNWIGLYRLNWIAFKVLGKQVMRISDLSVTEIQKVEEKIRREGWKLR